MMDIATMLAEASNAQTRFGFDEAYLADPDRRGDFFQMHLLGLFTEAGEVAEEVGYKSWSKSRGWANREQLADELADVLRFVFNIAYGAGLNTDELEDAWRGTQKKIDLKKDGKYEQRRTVR